MAYKYNPMPRKERTIIYNLRHRQHLLKREWENCQTQIITIEEKWRKK